MDTSKFLSKVIGLYFIIVSFSMLANMDQFTSYVLKLIHNESLMFVTGFFTLIIGLLMVVSHNVWRWSWRLIITIIAWITLLKGTSIIVYPHYMDHLSMQFMHDIYLAYAVAGFDFILGVLLCYFGFKCDQSKPRNNRL